MNNVNQLDIAPRHEVSVYKLAGEWYMDDQVKGIFMEPLVRGVPDIIEFLVRKRDRLNVGFSSHRKHSLDVNLIKGHFDDGGCWYQLEGTELKGWLCPILLRYFREAPENLYVSWK